MELLYSLAEDEAKKIGVRFLSDLRVDLPKSRNCHKCVYQDSQCSDIMLHGCRAGRCGYWIRTK